MMFETLKRFVEDVFDVLAHNDKFVDPEKFFDAYHTEWNGDDASLDFYKNSESPREDSPAFRLFGFDGSKGHPVLLWLDWCKNSPSPYEWMRMLWPKDCDFKKRISEFNDLRSKYASDECMNRFLRSLPYWEQKKLINYVMTEYNPSNQ